LFSVLFGTLIWSPGLPHVTLRAEAINDEIIVMQADRLFIATYRKMLNEPQLVLVRRTPSNDHELLARAWELANAKARELGWIA
jgi:hypothetical protein